MPEFKRLIATVRPADSARLLVKRRAWFDGDGTGDNGQGGQGEETPTAGDPLAGIEDPAGKIAALEKRLAERDAELAKMRQQFTTAEQERKKRMAEEGNFKALLEEAQAQVSNLSSYQERATALEKIIREGNETLVQRIPEDRRSLVPVSLPPEELRSWLDKNLALLVKPPAPNLDGGAGGTGTTGQEVQLTQEEKDYALSAGMTEKEYAEYKGKSGQPVTGSTFQG